MEIYQFEQFRTIAECGTMREAAEKLYLSQPTLSYNLKKLESELGCQLFTRARNRLVLTPYGEVVLEYTRALSERWSSMLAEVEEMKRREAATLHIGCFSTIVSSFLMPQIAADLPGSVFEVVNCSTAALVEGLKSGRFDVLIATDICRDKSFKWRKLYSEQAFLSAPLSSGIAGRDGVSAEDLQRLQFSIEAGLPGYSDWYAHILREAGVADEQVERIDLKEHLRVKDTLPTCNLITSFIMEFVHTSDARSIVRIDEKHAVRNVGLLYRIDASAKELAFAKHIRDSAAYLFGGNTFIPYFMFPEAAKNLHITTE